MNLKTDDRGRKFCVLPDLGYCGDEVGCFFLKEIDDSSDADYKCTFDEMKGRILRVYSESDRVNTKPKECPGVELSEQKKKKLLEEG